MALDLTRPPVCDRTLVESERGELGSMLQRMKEGENVESELVGWVLERTEAAPEIVAEVDKWLEGEDCDARVSAMRILALCFYNWQVKWPDFCVDILTSEVGWLWNTVVTNQPAANLTYLDTLLTTWGINLTFPPRSITAMQRTLRKSQAKPQPVTPTSSSSSSSSSSASTPVVAPAHAEITPLSYLGLLAKKIHSYRRQYSGR
eukprot:TRINITY_DN25532_c0_g1_i2.p1 TRINITY_DN25532_c0_g1~~TRINITY_DN25532_c0_g1_i2.p1  ORF type:complete len:214 (+),score=40.52 TRINITY_DN25532_c0_g1_i2:33-644(+)